MTLAHGPDERAGGDRDGARPRHARPRRGLPGRGARPRGVGRSATTRPGSSCTVRARSWPATSSTTTRRSTGPGCRRRRRPPRSTPPTRATILKIARDAYRAIGAEGFARVDFLLDRRSGLPVGDQHDPRVHPDQPVPGRWPPPAATPSASSPSGSSSSPLERHAGAVRPPADVRRTCPDERAPVDPRRPPGPRRSGRSGPAPIADPAGVGRAEPDPLAGAARDHPGRSSRCTGRTPARPSATGGSSVVGAGLHLGGDRPPRARPSPDGANLFRLSTDGMADRLRALPTVADASIEVALPDTLRVRLVERQPIVVWQVGERRFLVDADRVVFAEADAPVDLPVIDDRRVPVSAARSRRRHARDDGPAARCRGSASDRPRPGRLRRGDPARHRSGRSTSAAARPGST